MGVILLDQYSLLHFATGVIAYFFAMPFYLLMIVHILFEYLENTVVGMMVINQYLWWIWPGGKPRADTTINILGDNISVAVGWIMAWWLDITVGDPYRI